MDGAESLFAILAWPQSDLAVLTRCPCCQATSRQPQVSGLRDFTMGAAPGEWAMWRCDGCGCAYLDPRPTPESIGRAYSGYHTHEAANGRTLKVLNLARRIKFELIRRTVGLSSEGQAYKVRHISPGRRGERLLDVGFGAGGFLELADWLGYEAFGIDFDPQCVANAKARGYAVRQAGLPGSGLDERQFAHVTLCNVLEHVFDPAEALREIWRLLKPGGRLWLSQPNLAAPGARIYGRFWRGYEAPRHLTLWTPKDLRRLLEACGFVDVRQLPTDPTSHDLYFRESELQRRGFLPGNAPAPEVEAAAKVAASSPRARTPELGESLTMVGYRPPAAA